MKAFFVFRKNLAINFYFVLDLDLDLKKIQKNAQIKIPIDMLVLL
jgi:hypothetical protein